jgi:hypothetical protein
MKLKKSNLNPNLEIASFENYNYNPNQGYCTCKIGSRFLKI